MLKQMIRKIKQYFGWGGKPDFLIVGAAKCGTTSLYSYLEKYGKNFKPPLQKELYYFSESYGRGTAFYHSFFPMFKRGSVTGEATPDYLFYHKVPERVKAYDAGMKIVIILRDPVERAYSHYKHMNYTDKTSAADPESFSAAIRQEESRYHIDPQSKFYFEYKYFSYKKRGIYLEQIDRWLEHFSEEQVYILFLEDLGADFASEMTRLMQFLGIEHNGSPLVEKRHNVSPNASMCDEDREYLEHFFDGYNARLFEKLGRSSPWK